MTFQYSFVYYIFGREKFGIWKFEELKLGMYLD